MHVHIYQHFIVCWDKQKQHFVGKLWKFFKWEIDAFASYDNGFLQAVFIVVCTYVEHEKRWCDVLSFTGFLLFFHACKFA